MLFALGMMNIHSSGHKNEKSGCGRRAFLLALHSNFALPRALIVRNIRMAPACAEVCLLG